MSQGQITIVVVDDEPIIRMDVITMLENAGYNIVGQGSDGLDAINLCNEKQPDVILMDIKMGEIDGLCAAKEISKNCPDTAIIMLTAYSKSEYIDKAKECNISSYLIKPINEELLIPNIELAVARSKERKEYQEKAIEASNQLFKHKTVDKAKRLIMLNRNVDEKTAYQLIRDLSRKKNMSMCKVAELVVKQLDGK